MPDNTLTYTIVMVLLIMMSAFFSATETAFSSLNKTRLKTMAEKGGRKAKLACSLSDNYDKLISTILVGNNIVNIAAASLGTVIFVGLYGDIGATISTAVVTVVVLIFGEITPKSVAKDCPEKLAVAVSPAISALMWLLTPVNYLFSLWKRMIARLLKLEADNKMSQEELIMLVNEVQEDGSIDKNEGELLRNAIEFTEREAGDILTHRVELEAVPNTATKEEVAALFSESKYSRLLVYDGSIDNVIGVIHQKDLYEGTGLTHKPLSEIVTAPIFVVESEKVSELLRLLQKNKAHVAVVLDEYGGTYGMVTMEDILEELVGEIWDEHDVINEDFRPVGENVYRVDGAVGLADFCDFFDIETDSEAVSLNGWVIELLDRMPITGDCVSYENLSITVVSTDFHRLAQVEVRKLPNIAAGQTEE